MQVRKILLRPRQININNPLLSSEDIYKNSRDVIRYNLELLFYKYSPALEGTDADVLINVRKTGRDLLETIDFLYFSPWLTMSWPSDQLKESNYKYINEIYHAANTLILNLLTDNLNETQITAAKRDLENKVKAFLPGNEPLERVNHALNAFYFSLVALASIALICTGVLAPVGIGMAIGLITLGFFGGLIGGVKTVYHAKHANDSTKKQSLQFVEEIKNISDITQNIPKL